MTKLQQIIKRDEQVILVAGGTTIEDKGAFFAVFEDEITGSYRFVLTENTFSHYLKAEVAFRSFLAANCADFEKIGRLTPTNIYTTRSLTSAMTLESLFHKFELIGWLF